MIVDSFHIGSIWLHDSRNNGFALKRRIKLDEKNGSTISEEVINNRCKHVLSLLASRPMILFNVQLASHVGVRLE